MKSKLYFLCCSHEDGLGRSQIWSPEHWNDWDRLFASREEAREVLADYAAWDYGEAHPRFEIRSVSVLDTLRLAWRYGELEAFDKILDLSEAPEIPGYTPGESDGPLWDTMRAWLKARQEELGDQGDQGDQVDGYWKD